MDTATTCLTGKAGKQSALRPVASPEFEAESTRWTNVRQLNVESLAKEWEERPNLVKVLHDRKLRNNHLVMLRKECFESLVNIARDLNAGQAGFQIDLQLMVHQLDLLHHEMERENLLSPDKALFKVYDSMRLVCSRICSQFVVFSRSDNEPDPTLVLNDEEQRLLDGIAAEPE